MKVGEAKVTCCNIGSLSEEAEVVECGAELPREEGVFYSGNDLARHKPVASGDACSEMCNSETLCKAWSFHVTFKRWH